MPARHALRADLHAHSTASDGTLSPAELVEMARQRGLSILALTDHDTLGGIDEAIGAARERSIMLVPGIEFSTTVERGELHLLGYGVDHTNAELQQKLAELRDSRRARNLEMIARLQSAGFDLDEDELMAGGSADSIGRPHIARAMIDKGYVDTVAEAFDRYLMRGRPGWAPRKTIMAEDAIALVLQAQGLPVLAHPFSVRNLDTRLSELIEVGLAGLEVYYGEYDEAQRAQLADLAAERGLLPTGGSDFHGKDSREGRDLGGVDLPDRVIESFLDALRRTAFGSSIA